MKNHEKELDCAKWLSSTFGGDIEMVKEKTDDGFNPDYIWKGKLWDEKDVSSFNSIYNNY